MFPIRDDIPAKRFPVVTISLIILNVFFFLYEVKLGSSAGRFLMEYGFVPIRYNSIQENNLFDISRFTPVFSSLFLHGGWIHLISNMWMLWIFGDNVEDSMGHRRCLGFYLLCGVLSVWAQAAFNPQSSVPLIGASGAISGVLGAYFLTYPKARVLALVPLFIIYYMVEIPAYFFLGFWFVLQALQGYTQLVNVGTAAKGGVAWWAHIGGFASGLLLVYFFRQKQDKKSKVRVRRPKKWH